MKLARKGERGNIRRYHLCLVKGARCIAVIASGRSNPLAVLAAMTRTATAIVEAAMIVSLPVSTVVTGALAAIAAGKIL
jgi:hypothetical protein